MKNILILATALTGLSLTAPAALAGNAGASLAACYDHVIAACNKTNHPQSCSSAGMDDCDELHSANIQTGGQMLKIKGVTPRRVDNVVIQRAPQGRQDTPSESENPFNRR